MAEDHRVDGVREHHAGSCFIRKHRIFGRTNRFIKAGGTSNVFDGQVHENQLRHVIPPLVGLKHPFLILVFYRPPDPLGDIVGFNALASPNQRKFACTQ
ncbi:hypothetical protein D3C87_1720230 [compost metagenome]